MLLVNQLTGFGAQSAAGEDPYFANVSLLLHFDGADTSTTFTDHSSYGHTVTANGHAQIDTAQSVFGGASGLFDGTDDYLSMSDAGEFDFGTGDFTVEFWIRLASGAESSDHSILVGSAAGNLMVRLGGVGGKKLGIGRNDVAWDSYTVAMTLSSETWYHMAVTRDSSDDVRMFLDGVSQTMEGGGTGNSNTYSMDSVYVGTHNGFGADLNGHLDDLRVTKGVARYTGNFTPPAAAYPNS
jgi:hypothetical protein